MKKRSIIVGVITIVVIVAVMLIFVLSHKNLEAGKEQENIGDNIRLQSMGTSLGDEQNYWNGQGCQSFAAAEDGYYFITSDGAYLMYFDIATKDAIPVCNKPDCTHKDKSCGCYLNNQSYSIGNIYYHQEKLYYMPIVNGMAVLTEMDATGGNRKEIAPIMPSDGGNGMHLTFHGRYAYAYDFVSHIIAGKEYTEKIIEISLDTGETKIIYEYTGTNTTIQYVKSFGEKLYFTVQELVINQEKGYSESRSKGLYAYDYNTKEVTTVSEKNVHDYCVIPDEGWLYYYVTGEGLYRYDIKTEDIKLVSKATEGVDMCNVSYDGQYIYLSNFKWVNYMSRVVKSAKKKCIVIDKEGQIINDISCDGFMTMFFGDDRFMFAEKPGEGSENGLLYIDKKNIATVKEWTRIMEEGMSLDMVR